jgi:hypothetical protein
MFTGFSTKKQASSGNNLKSVLAGITILLFERDWQSSVDCGDE